jgi:transcriptional regulator with XRE-family HTH domain
LQGVPAGPVRAYVRAILATGMTRAAIAEAAGVGVTTVDRLLQGYPSVQEATARALLAVLPAWPVVRAVSHGAPAGAAWHRRRQERPCEECAAAVAAYKRTRRAGGARNAA